MSDKIKANRQAIEYYKVAQELLALATNDASDFIDDYEDRDISGSDFKRESSGWVSHLDDIIDDLKGKPDPLNLLPKAIALRKQLGQVASRPADDISYDMQHAAGSQTQSKERFWNKISNMFDSVISSEPDIIRAPRTDILDVFEESKPGYANQRLANTRRDKPQVSNIPDKPKVTLSGRVQPQSNGFVKPTYGQRVEAATNIENKHKVEIDKQPVIEAEPETIVEVKPAEEVKVKPAEVKQEKLSLADKIRLKQQQEQLLQASEENLKVDDILSAASEAAYRLSNTFEAEETVVKGIFSGVIDDVSNMSSNLMPLINTLNTVNDIQDFKNLREVRPEIIASILNLTSDYVGDDLFGKTNNSAFIKRFGDRIIGGISLTSRIDIIKNEFDQIAQLSKDGRLKSKKVYTSMDLVATRKITAEIINHIAVLKSHLDFIEKSGEFVNISENYESLISREFKALGSELKNPNSDVSKFYINNKYYPDDINNKDRVEGSLESLRRKLNQDKNTEALDDIADNQVRPYYEGGKRKDPKRDPNKPSRFKKSFKSNQSKQLSGLINLIEDKIESPFEHSETEDIVNEAPFLFNELDKQSRGLDKDPTTSGAALSVNKLKNKLLKVIRNTALAMQPEFKGEMVSASQNAVQQLEIAFENTKVEYAPQRQANLKRDKPKVANIPDLPKTRVGYKPLNEKNGFHKESPLSNDKIDLKPVDRKDGNDQDEYDEYLKPELIATVALKLIQDINDHINSDKIQPQYFRSILAVAKEDITKSLLSIKKNFANILKIYNPEGDLGGSLDVYENVSNEILNIVANIQSITTNIQINRRAITMMDDKSRKTIDESLRRLNKYKDDLENHMENFKSLDLSSEDLTERWTNTLGNIVKSVLSDLNVVINALINISQGYIDLISEIRLFADDIIHADGMYNDFIHEHGNVNNIEEIKDAILDYIGRGRSYIKSLIRYYEKTYRLGNW